MDLCSREANCKLKSSLRRSVIKIHMTWSERLAYSQGGVILFLYNFDNSPEESPLPKKNNTGNAGSYFKRKRVIDYLEHSVQLWQKLLICVDLKKYW